MTVSLTPFESAQPFAVEYLSAALSHGQLTNSLLFVGQDMSQLYAMALTMAQIINCSGKPSATTACGVCQNCRWISQNAHPAVITLTPRNNFSEKEIKEKRTKAKQTISVSQLQELMTTLSLNAGETHRVVILAGALEASVVDTSLTKKATPSPLAPLPYDWTEANPGKTLALQPLDSKNFGASPANKFLKTLEEPPKNVLFFLLTDSVERLLETIVSRCQKVPFRAAPALPMSTEDQATFAKLLAVLNTPNYMVPLKTFQDIQSETDRSAVDLLKGLTGFFGDYVLTQTTSDPMRFNRAQKALKLMDQASRMIADKTREEAVLEDMFLQIGQL